MGAATPGGASPRKPARGAGARKGTSGANARPHARRASTSRRPSGSPRRRPTDPNRLHRTNYGFPSIGARLNMQRAARPFRRSVIGSTVKHNGSLGYIGRGRFGGSRRQRALRAQVVRFAPAVLGVALVVVCAAAIGYAVQGAWNPLAIFQAPAAAGDAGFAAAAAERMRTLPSSAVLAGRAPDAVVLDAGRTTASGDGHVTFSAVGDNLANENLLELADAAAGETGDDTYDFNGFYDNIRSAIQSYDVAFVNQETTLGGPDAYGYNGYPSYNTPDSMADAVAATGWRVVSTNTNHTYDTWTASIEHAQQVWAAKSDQLLTIGSFTSQEERERPRVVECNGMRLAFLSYNYGQNGYEQSDLPNDYYAVPYDRDAMLADVQRARRAADAVVVYMHWGTEYENEPDETQRARAQELADAGVDLVIGSHAHVIQPMEWLEGADGGRTLVVYGLGDLWSGYFDAPDCILSGMFTCEFVRTDAAGAASGAAGADGSGTSRRVSIENVVWYPVIEHWENNQDTIYLVQDYSGEQARANELLSSLDDPYQWIIDTTNEVIGSDFKIAV